MNSFDQTVQQTINLIYTVTDFEQRQQLTIKFIEGVNHYLNNYQPSGETKSETIAPDPRIVDVNPTIANLFSTTDNKAAAVSYCMKDFRADKTLIDDFKAYLKEVSLQDFTNHWMLLNIHSAITVHLFSKCLPELDDFFARTMISGGDFRPLASINIKNEIPNIKKPERDVMYLVSSRLKLATGAPLQKQKIYYGFKYSDLLIEKGVKQQAETPTINTIGHAGFVLNRIKQFYQLK